MRGAIYQSNVWGRAAVLWLVFMIITWLVAGIAYLSHPNAWQNVPAVDAEKGWNVFLFIVASNSVLLALIVSGNLFVRFGAVTVGLVILLWQAVAIGWTAGTNGFMDPFPSFAAANRAFLFIGLWEITAYVLLCAATVTKSLLISESFPARKWSEQRSLKDLRFTRSEWIVVAISIFLLLGAGAIEAFVPYETN